MLPDKEYGEAAQDLEIPLKSLNIGLWNKRSTEHANLTALVLHSSKNFVFLIDKTSAPTVEWQHIVGIDYSNPLCLAGRVVLESKHVIKREFSSMRRVAEFYVPNFPLANGGDQSHLSGNDGGTPRSPMTHEYESLGRLASHRGVAEAVSPSIADTEGEAFPGLERSQSKKRKFLDELSPILTPAVDSLPSKNGSLGADDMQPENVLSSSANPEAPVLWSTAGIHFPYRSIAFNFESPNVPAALQPVIQGDERLLKLYESGLPAWSIYAPQYGLWYRPWMRTLTYALFILVSAFSLVVGFYDLYKNVPYLDEVLRKFGSTYFPLSAIRTWLDQHVSFRLSILFAYLFGKSELAVQLLKWLGAAGNIGRAMLEPLNIYLRPFTLVITAFVRSSWAQAASASLALWQGSRVIGLAVFGPPFALVAEMLSVLCQSCWPPLQVVTNLALAVALGPWALLRFLGTLCFGWGSLVVQLAQAVGQGFLVGWKSVRLGLQVAPSVAGSAKDVGSQVTGWYFLVRLEALEVVKNSTVKVIKALQTLARLCTQIAGDIARHRQATMAIAWPNADQERSGSKFRQAPSGLPDVQASMHVTKPFKPL